ncbi:MAG: hypothetical protein IPP32_17650 [Bacteroidetes bacterium]|nr:hypothetical protein [Bacteroidota bacterium]
MARTLWITLISLFFFSNNLLAQLDTTETARQLSYIHKYAEADALLTAFEKTHPNDINAVRLHAQILYWMKDYSAALNLCSSYLKNNPEWHFLKLDYARMLYELQQWKKAKVVLIEYQVAGNSNIEAKNMLATIAYWQGKTKTSEKLFNAVLNYYPTNEWAKNYLNEIKNAKAPYAKLTSCYSSDTQPMSALHAGIETGVYRSHLLAPKFTMEWQKADSGNSSATGYSSEISNKFFFSGIKTEIQLSAGIVTPLATNSIHGIGTIEVKNQFHKNFSISLCVARKNYQYTLSNFSTAIMYTDYAATISFFKEKIGSGKTAYTFQQFDDNNSVQQYYAWLLSPALRLSKFEFYLGYNFNYSSSQYNRYNLTTTPLQAIVQFDESGKIPAAYSPYFTPQNQQIHSLLANVIFTTGKKTSIALNAN